MNVKLIGVVLLSSLFGLAGGGISSYFIYQQQISNLKSDLVRVNEILYSSNLTLQGTLYNLTSEISSLTSEIRDYRKELKNFNEKLEGKSFIIQERLNELTLLISNINNALIDINAKFNRLLLIKQGLEKIEFKSAYATKNKQDNVFVFEINIEFYNTGTADAVLDMIFLNGKPYYLYAENDSVIICYAPSGIKVTNLNDIIVKSGYSFKLLLYLTVGDTWKSGMTVEIRLQTISGKQYPKSIILP